MGRDGGGGGEEAEAGQGAEVRIFPSTTIRDDAEVPRASAITDDERKRALARFRRATVRKRQGRPASAVVTKPKRDEADDESEPIDIFSTVRDRRSAAKATAALLLRLQKKFPQYDPTEHEVALPPLACVPARTGGWGG
jgi:hypothetical protein